MSIPPAVESRSPPSHASRRLFCAATPEFIGQVVEEIRVVEEAVSGLKVQGKRRVEEAPAVLEAVRRSVGSLPGDGFGGGGAKKPSKGRKK